MDKIILGKNEVFLGNLVVDANGKHYVGNNSSIIITENSDKLKFSGAFKEIQLHGAYNFKLNFKELISCDTFYMYESLNKREKSWLKGKLPVDKFKSGYGYKKVKDEYGNPHVIRLTFPTGTEFVCPNHLGIKFRSSQCVVDAWFNPITKRWNKSGKSFFSIGSYGNLVYKVGELITADWLDTVIDMVCTGGIHFFTHFRQADLYSL